MDTILPNKIDKYSFRSIYLLKQYEYHFNFESPMQKGILFLDTFNSAAKLLNLKITVNPFPVNNYNFSLNLDKSEEITFNTVYFFMSPVKVLFDSDINAYYFNNKFKRTDDDIVKNYIISDRRYNTMPLKQQEERLYEGLYLFFETNSISETISELQIALTLEELDINMIRK